MSSTKANLKKMQRAASTPEARAKAVATMKRRRAEREKFQAEVLRQAKNEIPLDQIPDDKPAKKWAKRKDPRIAAVVQMLRFAAIMLEEM